MTKAILLLVWLRLKVFYKSFLIYWGENLLLSLWCWSLTQNHEVHLIFLSNAIMGQGASFYVNYLYHWSLSCLLTTSILKCPAEKIFRERKTIEVLRMTTDRTYEHELKNYPWICWFISMLSSSHYLSSLMKQSTKHFPNEEALTRCNGNLPAV